MDVDWINLARDSDKWWSDAVKFSAAKAWGTAWLADELGALHESFHRENSALHSGVGPRIVVILAVVILEKFCKCQQKLGRANCSFTVK
jgi:hypothetical protein